MGKIKEIFAIIGGVVIFIAGIAAALFFGRNRSKNCGNVGGGEDSSGIENQADMVRGDLQSAGQSLSSGQDRLDENKRRSEERSEEREKLLDEARNGFQSFTDDARGEEDAD